MRKVILLLVVGLTTSCASVINGKFQTVKVNSNPPGATAIADGKMSQLTPCAFELRREESHVVEVKLEGHKTYRILVESSEGGAIFGNILLGGIIGAVVDSGTGASKVLDPDDINVEMEKGQGVVTVPRPIPETRPVIDTRRQ
jgi:PEGA domain